MFDVMPSNKPKVEPQKPKTQIGKSNAINEKDLKLNNSKSDQLSKTQIKPASSNNEAKPSSNNANNANNKTNTQNANAANTKFTGSDSDYGVIIPEFKKCRPTDKTQLGKVENIEIILSNPEKKEYRNLEIAAGVLAFTQYYKKRQVQKPRNRHCCTCLYAIL